MGYARAATFHGKSGDPIVIDGVYQFIVFRWFYPGEALTVAIVLAIVPYLQIRGLANSIARDSIKTKGREVTQQSNQPSSFETDSG